AAAASSASPAAGASSQAPGAVAAITAASGASSASSTSVRPEGTTGDFIGSLRRLGLFDQAGDEVFHLPAFDLGCRRQQQPVAQRRGGERLDVVGQHVVAAMKRG